MIRINRLKNKTNLITNKHLVLWERALTEGGSFTKNLIHGDLHPNNIIVSKGKIIGVIDWGDICIGDAATDLASLWMLFNNKGLIKEAFRYYGASESLIIRSIGWAIFFGVTMLDTGLDLDPKQTKIGKSVLDNILCATHLT